MLSKHPKVRCFFSTLLILIFSSTLAQQQVSLEDYESSTIDWRQASGQTIVLAGLQHPWMSAVTPLLPQFTELTGIEVQVDVASESEYISRMPVLLAGGSRTPDVFMVWAMGQAVSAGWLEPLDAYYTDSALTDPDWYNEEDIFDSARQFPVWPEDDTRYAVAITAEAQTLFLNRSALEEAGLEVPTTFEELDAAAVALDTDQRSGIAMRAKPTGDAVSWTVAGFIFSYGGQIIDEAGRAAFDSPEAVAAVDMYARLLREAGPLGVGSYHWYEALNDYMQGRTAISSDSSNFAVDIEDPEQSRVAGQTIYAAFPSAGELPSKPNMWHWLAGMNANSQNKEAAWLFLQWVTSEPTSLLIGRNRAAPTRTSVWEDEGFREVFGAEAAEAALVNLQAADGAVMTRTWFHSQAPQVLDLLAVAVNEVIIGQSDAQAALADAARQANRILGQ